MELTANDIRLAAQKSGKFGPIILRQLNNNGNFFHQIRCGQTRNVIGSMGLDGYAYRVFNKNLLAVENAKQKENEPKGAKIMNKFEALLLASGLPLVKFCEIYGYSYATLTDYRYKKKPFPNDAVNDICKLLESIIELSTEISNTKSIPKSDLPQECISVALGLAIAQAGGDLGDDETIGMKFKNKFREKNKKSRLGKTDE